MSDLNKRGRKRDDSSSLQKSAVAPAVTVSLPQRKTYQTQLHVVFLECLSEGRIREKRGK
jgi:hypothetical protein